MYCHTRENGHLKTALELDSRLRGNDLIVKYFPFSEISKYNGFGKTLYYPNLFILLNKISEP